MRVFSIRSFPFKLDPSDRLLWFFSVRRDYFNFIWLRFFLFGIFLKLGFIEKYQRRLLFFFFFFIFLLFNFINVSIIVIYLIELNDFQLLDRCFGRLWVQDFMLRVGSFLLVKFIYGHSSWNNSWLDTLFFVEIVEFDLAVSGWVDLKDFEFILREIQKKEESYTPGHSKEILIECIYRRTLLSIVG